MWSSWLSQSTLPALEQATAFAEKRHLLLAGNIANIDTPDYTTRDLSVDDFHAALKSYVEDKAVGNTNSRVPSLQDSMNKVRDVQNQVLYHDGSDVSLEEQVTQLSKNQAMHNTALALMRSQFQTLQIAIRESAAV